MNSANVSDAIFDLVDTARHMDPTDPIDDLADGLDVIHDVRTFEQAGVITTDSGFVLEMADGSEYQVTVVQSKHARTPAPTAPTAPQTPTA